MSGGFLKIKYSPTLKFEQLEANVDLIAKVRVGDSRDVRNDWFPADSALKVVETDLEIISSVKGTIQSGETVKFHHYQRVSNQAISDFMASAAHRQLYPGHVYLVAACKCAGKDAYRQHEVCESKLGDQGILLCITDSMIPEEMPKKLKSVVWHELTTHLSPSAYQGSAKRRLIERNLSRIAEFGRKDLFDSTQVIDWMLGMIQLESAAGEALQMKAIQEIGRGSFLNANRSGSKETEMVIFGSGFQWHDTDWSKYVQKNPGAARTWPKLIEIANQHQSLQVRATAIRALHGIRNPEIESQLRTWIQSEDEHVLEAALLLLADYSQSTDAETMIENLGPAASNQHTSVRLAVARTIGLGQVHSRISLLNELLQDQNEDVRKQAMYSLLAFSNEESEKILEANINHHEYCVPFLVAAFKLDPEKWIDKMAEYLVEAPDVKLGWNGRYWWKKAWFGLAEYLGGDGAMFLHTEEANKAIAALEYPVDNELKPNQQFYAANIAALYKLYLENDMPERATSLRERCKQTFQFHFEQYLRKIDQEYGR